MRRRLVLVLAAACAAPPSPDAGDTDVPDSDVPDSDVPDSDTPDSDTPDSDTPDSDTPDSDAPDSDTASPDTDTAAPDLRLTGPFAVLRTTGRTQAASGCGLPWERFRAQGGGQVPLVVLTHGLERTKAQMTTWARHLASWGLDVVTPTSCQASVLDLDQEQNGLDLIDLATDLGATEVIYAGHSAGGLASWVATARDPRAVGLFGLDPTEWLGIGAEAAPGISVPAFGLVGDAGTCNAFGSGVGLLDGVGATALRVVDADHCDFETPTDAVCTVPCGRGSNRRFTEAELRTTIRGLMTAGLRDLAGLSDDGPVWWASGGARFDVLAAEGRVRAP